MAKSRNAEASKAAKAEAKAARKAAARQRRTQLWQAFNLQRKEDKRLLPYMITAFVVIVAASVVAGVAVGGLTMILMIPLGVVLGAAAVRLFSFTPGQYACRLLVTSVDQRVHVGTGRAVVRGLLIAFVVPALFVDSDGRGIQDRVTATAVVRR